MPKKTKKTEKNEIVIESNVDIVAVAVGDLKPNEYNPNQQNVESFDLLTKSIEQDGFTLPVVVNSGETNPELKNMIVDGEHRWRAALILNMPEVPVIYKDLDEGQMRTSTIRHNRARGHHDNLMEAKVLSELVGEIGADEVGEQLNVDSVELSAMLGKSEDFTSMEEVGALQENDVLETLGEQGLEGDQAQKVAKRHGIIDRDKHLSSQDESQFGNEKGQQVRLELVYSGEQADFMRQVVSKYGSARDAVLALVGE